MLCSNSSGTVDAMTTTHRVVTASSASMNEIDDSSVELIVTSPPYPMIEMWDSSFEEADPRVGLALRDHNGSAVSGPVGAGYGSGDPVLDTGAAYVYIRSGASWVEQAVLRAADDEANDQFGHAVAVDGDSVLVGAFSENGGSGNPLVDSGAVYVFARNGSSWSEQAILRASDADLSALFGSSVALSGSTALVGAARADGAGTMDSGAAYVFERDGESWTEQVMLEASNPGANDRFGIRVSIAGDTVLIGALQEDGGDGDPASDAGAAYLYVYDGSAWNEDTILRASEAQPGDFYGSAVAVTSDFAVVGAFAEDGGNGDPVANAGAGYVYR